MSESHRSLAQDFEVSTPGLDALVEDLVARAGVLERAPHRSGVRGMRGGAHRAGALDLRVFRTPAWRVRAAGGAHLVSGS